MGKRIRPGYKRAVQWVADNDDFGSEDPAVLGYLTSALLVADMWGKDPVDVGRDILRRRRLDGLLSAAEEG